MVGQNYLMRELSVFAENSQQQNPLYENLDLIYIFLFLRDKKTTLDLINKQ